MSYDRHFPGHGVFTHQATLAQLFDPGSETEQLDVKGLQHHVFAVTCTGLQIGNVAEVQAVGSIDGTNYQNIASKIADRWPTSHWRLDGDAYDSENANHGTVTSGTYVSGKIASGIRFDAGSGNVNIPDMSNLDVGDGEPFAVSFWFNPLAATLASTQYNLVSKKQGFNSSLVGWQIWWRRDTNRLSVRLNSGAAANDDEVTNTSNVNATLDTAAWHHIVCQVGSTRTANFYLNGSSVGGGTAATQTGSLANSIAFRIGASPTDSTLNGCAIDEVAVFKNIILSQAEISHIYNGGTGRQNFGNFISEDGTHLVYLTERPLSKILLQLAQSNSEEVIDSVYRGSS